MRRIFHRAWNDIKRALSQTGLWYVILLICVVFSLPFGPWEGQAWFRKIQEMAETAFTRLTSANPMFAGLYEYICHGIGVKPEGSAEHRQMVFNRVFASDAFKVQGEKVSLRRWFSWLAAAHVYLPL